MKMTRTKKYILTILTLVVTSATYAAKDNTNGQTTVYLVSDAHLDTQWNWDVQTTIKEYVRNTLIQNLYLLDRYPEYVFNFEGGVKYAWMKEYFPREYELMKQYIKSGRWHIAGASWDANDVIVPSIESQIRNILLGQEYYRKEFGVESTDIFLPDCFGFGWTLPTVASHCGLIGFSSQKLRWRHNNMHGNMKYPFNAGIWRGVDGSEIMMVHGYNYTQTFPDEDLTENTELKEYAKENNLGKFYHYYGTGDKGGSPTLTSVEAVTKASAKSGNGLKILNATSDRFYKDHLPFSDHPELPRYEGELLMDVHGTGCYTSQAAMKLYNRQNELLGDAAERAAVAAEMIGASPYPSSAMTEAWRRFIFHQFHDDLTGTSIPRVYEFSWNDELLSLKQFGDVLTHSSDAVISRLDTRVQGIPVVFYNALGHETADVVEFDVPTKARPAKVTATDHNGQRVYAQILGFNDGKTRVAVEATVPGTAYAVYSISFSGSARNAEPQPTNTIENSVYRITIDENGDITSLYNKTNRRELVADGKAIRLAIFTDNESNTWPAWEISRKSIEKSPNSINGGVIAEIIEKGPFRTTMRIEKKHGDSKFVQFIRLYEGKLADRIDFFNEVDWATRNAFVKAEFPLSVSNEKACYNLGLGTIMRGNNTDAAYEVYAQKWADLTDKAGDYGITIMTDCKYGWDKPDDNTLRLTLLNTPKTEKRYAYHNHQDLGRHTFTYSINAHTGDLDKAKANRQADALNQRIKAFSASKHAGDLGRVYSAASTSDPSISIAAFKKAESSDEYVVRIYEIAGKGTANATVTFASPIVAAVEADGTEKTIGDATYSGNKLNFSIKPNGIKTFKVRFRESPMLQNVEYAIIPLKHDKQCFSWNHFGAEADFCNGYSYAAELIPPLLTANSVPFSLDSNAFLNGKKCKGDTIAVPEGYNRIYILAAAALEKGQTEGIFISAGQSTSIATPSYTGFVGQWGHTGHTDGYLLDDEVAFVGTHRHSKAGDHPYEFTYMFKYGIDIPEGASNIVLPDNPAFVIFAATAVKEPRFKSAPMTPLFQTSITPK